MKPIKVMIVESGCTVCCALEVLDEERGGIFVAGYICGHYDDETEAGVVLCREHADLLGRTAAAMSAEMVTVKIAPAVSPS